MTAENPRVNRYLEDKDMDHIDHALGRPVYPMIESYRNNFAIDADSPVARSFDASPHWVKRGQQGDMAFYSVTDEGRKALADHLAKQDEPWRAWAVSFGGFTSIIPERTRGKAKYAYYLLVSDSCPDLTFGDFQKQATVRAA